MLAIAAKATIISVIAMISSTLCRPMPFISRKPRPRCEANISASSVPISVSENPVASQPAPFGEGETVVLPRTSIGVDDGGGASLAMIGGGASLSSLVSGLNTLGVSPRDLITILQALRTSGALQAEIEVQ